MNALTMLTFDNTGEKYRGLVVGSEEDLDRAVEYLTSMAVVDSLAERFKLYEHYNINMKNKNHDKIFYHVFGTKNKVSFSDNSVVTIKCYDVDSTMSYKLAGAFLDLAEGFYESVTRRKEGLAFTSHIVDSLEHRHTEILDSLAILRDKYGIFVMNNEGDAVSAVMAERMRNNPDFRMKYDKLRFMEFDLSATFHLRHDMQVEKILRLDNLNKLPRLSTVVQKPVMTNFKARPKRSIIVAVAMGSMLLFASLLVLLLDRSKDKLPI